MAHTERQPSKEPSIPATARPAYDAIVGLTNGNALVRFDSEVVAA